MPCPYFEPQQVVRHPACSHARLPLIEEYEGVCQANGEPRAAQESKRLACCNHGNARGRCDRFPPAEIRSALNYHLVRRTPTELQVLLIEEDHHTPVYWQSVSFFLEGERLDPAIDDLCKRAQVLAFCRSFLKRFPE